MQSILHYPPTHTARNATHTAQTTLRSKYCNDEEDTQ